MDKRQYLGSEWRWLGFVLTTSHAHLFTGRHEGREQWQENADLPIADSLLQKSREAALNAVQVFNNPFTELKASIYS